MPGQGVDLHPVYQRGVTALPGVDFGWLKLTDGAAPYRTPADSLAQVFRARGVPFGGYCYAQPGDGAAEAQVLWAECQRLGAIGVAPAVDIESDPHIHVWSPGEATAHGRAFCSWFRARGIRPAVYMGASFMNTVRPDLWPEDPVIWVARYGAKPEDAGAGHYGGRYDVHQYTSSGALPGSAGAVDWNQAHTTGHLLGGQTSGEDDMTPDERDMLKRVYGQLTGTEDVHAPVSSWGFPSKEYPASRATPVDFIRAMDQNVIHLLNIVSRQSEQIAALTAKVDALTPKTGA
jgi:hypothetical protein